MSNPISTFNLPAVALNVLQARNTAVVDAVASAAGSERQSPELLQQESEALARQTAQSSGGPIPRGQFINILV
ncbi:MAG TPA: hypothetical protein VLX09_20815 [Stellaceae bacterium]|nr:hypothetical protein [Stellaceae bacterium]